MIHKTRTWLFPDLTQRSDIPELMDDPHSDQAKLDITLDQFRLINMFLTRSHMLLKKIFVPYMMKDKKHEYTLVDIGAGGGDVAIRFARYCRAQGIKMEIILIDTDPRVVAYAKRACADYKNITVFQADALQVGKIQRPVDFVFANHFLHHIPDDMITEVISTIAQTAYLGFLFNDIIRAPSAYILFTLLSAFCFRNSFAFYDGRMSIRKSFTEQEFAALFSPFSSTKPITIKTAIPWRIYAWWIRESS